MLVKAFETAKNEDKDTLIYWIENNSQPDEKIIAIRQLYDKLSVSEKTQMELKNYYKKAINALNKVSVETDIKKALGDIAENLIEREC